MAAPSKQKEPASYAGKYVILHNLVGTHFEGEIVEWTEDEAKKFGELVKDAEHPIARFLRVGAIRKATDEDTGPAVKWGDGTSDVPKPFPPVPFEGVTAAQAAVVEATSAAEEGAK